MNKENFNFMERLYQEQAETQKLVKRFLVQMDADAAFALRANQKLERIQLALDRVNNGIYGLCLSCGHPIHPDRLSQIPYTELCLVCRQKEEHLETTVFDTLHEGGSR